MSSLSISPKVDHTHICRDCRPTLGVPCVIHVLSSFLETGLCELEFQVWSLPSGTTEALISGIYTYFIALYCTGVLKSGLVYRLYFDVLTSKVLF